jgi:MFS family permease
VLFVASLAVFLSGPAQTYGVSVFIDPLIAETGWSRSIVSTAYSTATLLSAVALFLIGRQIDRLGHRVVLIATTIGFGLALLLSSSVAHPLTLVAGFALLRACGSGILTLTARTLIPQWFVRRRGRAFSLLGLAGTLSLAATPPFGEALISWVGWRNAWRIEALIIWLVLLPAIIWFVHDRPEIIGQHPDGEPPPEQTDGEQAEPAETAWTLKQAQRLPAFWFLLGAGIVPSLVVTGLSFNQISIFTDRGLPTTLAATTFTVESAIALPMTFLSGWMSDRYPSRYVLAAGQFFLAAALICLLLVNSVALAVLYAGLRGASMGLWTVAADVTWPEYFGRRYLGSIRGMTFAIGVVGAAIGPLPLGFVYDATGSYEAAIAGLLALPILGMVAILQAKPPGKPPAHA